MGKNDRSNSVTNNELARGHFAAVVRWGKIKTGSLMAYKRRVGLVQILIHRYPVLDHAFHRGQIGLFDGTMIALIFVSGPLIVSGNVKSQRKECMKSCPCWMRSVHTSLSPDNCKPGQIELHCTDVTIILTAQTIYSSMTLRHSICR